MRYDLSNGIIHDTGTITATPAAPSSATDGDPIVSLRGARPDSAWVVVSLTGGTSATVEGMLYAYHAELGWIPSTVMHFGDGDAALADTGLRITSGAKQVILAPWMERVYLLLDMDNASGTPTGGRGVVSVDEHREHV